jgi:hypothetical protein
MPFDKLGRTVIVQPHDGSPIKSGMTLFAECGRNMRCLNSLVDYDHADAAQCAESSCSETMQASSPQKVKKTFVLRYRSTRKTACFETPHPEPFFRHLVIPCPSTFLAACMRLWRSTGRCTQRLSPSPVGRTVIVQPHDGSPIKSGMTLFGECGRNMRCLNGRLRPRGSRPMR